MAAALREAGEEAGIWLTRPAAGEQWPAGLAAGELYEELSRRKLALDASGLVLLSSWLTPPGASRRFDTGF